VGLVVVLALAGCSDGDGGGDGESSEARRERGGAREEPTTPTAATTADGRIDVYEPIPGGSLHGTPRPPLENTGTDYVAIFESLIAQIRWLDENPNPALIPDIFMPGTADHDAGVTTQSDLVASEQRWADEGFHLIEVEVLDVQPQYVSLRYRDSMEYVRVVDRAGHEVRTRARPEPVATWSALMVPDGSARWRFASISPAPEA